MLPTLDDGRQLGCWDCASALLPNGDVLMVLGFQYDDGTYFYITDGKEYYPQVISNDIFSLSLRITFQSFFNRTSFEFKPDNGFGNYGVPPFYNLLVLPTGEILATFGLNATIFQPPVTTFDVRNSCKKLFWLIFYLFTSGIMAPSY